MVGPLNILGLISMVVRNHKGKTQARLFIMTKGRISDKTFNLVNWERIKYTIKSIPFGTKLGAINFAGRFCVTWKMMNIMGAWPSNLFPCWHEEKKTQSVYYNRNILIWYTSSKKKHSIVKQNQEQLDTKLYLLRSWIHSIRVKVQNLLKSSMVCDKTHS